MRRVLAVSALCLGLVAPLAACGSDEPAAPQQELERAQAYVDVDTPQLRAQKRRAGVEDCEPGSASNELPQVTLPCLGGGPAVDLSRLQGPAVVNLFAQWCGPCRVELPFFQRLHEEAGADLTVLGVDFQDVQPSAALDLVEETGVTFPLVADPAGLLKDELRVRGLPGIVLVDETGAVVSVEFRKFDSYAELRDLVERRLGVRAGR